VDNFIICKSFGLGCSWEYWLNVFAKTSSTLKCIYGPFPQSFTTFGSSCLHQFIMNGLENLILRCLWKNFTNGLGIPCISLPNNLSNINKILPTNIYNVVFSFVKKKFEKKLNKIVYISPYDFMERLKNNIHSLVTSLFPIFQQLWMIKCWRADFD